jgi:hypothetical protein
VAVVKQANQDCRGDYDASRAMSGSFLMINTPLVINATSKDVPPMGPGIEVSAS